jgi:hypothetical protein
LADQSAAKAFDADQNIFGRLVRCGVSDHSAYLQAEIGGNTTLADNNTC